MGKSSTSKKRNNTTTNNNKKELLKPSPNKSNQQESKIQMTPTKKDKTTPTQTPSSKKMKASSKESKALMVNNNNNNKNKETKYDIPTTINHRCRFVKWTPEGIKCIAANEDGTKLAVLRNSGDIELRYPEEKWRIAAHFPGTENTTVHTMKWANVVDREQGELVQEGLFVGTMDGFISRVDFNIRLHVKHMSNKNVNFYIMQIKTIEIKRYT